MFIRKNLFDYSEQFLSQILRSFFKQLPIFLCRSSSKNKILIYLLYAVVAWEDQYTILLLYVEKSFCINVTFYIFFLCKSTVPILFFFFHKCVGKVIHVRKYTLSNVCTVRGWANKKERGNPRPPHVIAETLKKLRLVRFLHRYKVIPEDIFSIQFQFSFETRNILYQKYLLYT